VIPPPQNRPPSGGNGFPSPAICFPRLETSFPSAASTFPRAASAAPGKRPIPPGSRFPPLRGRSASLGQTPPDRGIPSAPWGISFLPTGAAHQTGEADRFVGNSIRFPGETAARPGNRVLPSGRGIDSLRTGIASHVTSITTLGKIRFSQGTERFILSNPLKNQSFRGKFLKTTAQASPGNFHMSAESGSKAELILGRREKIQIHQSIHLPVDEDVRVFATSGRHRPQRCRQTDQTAGEAVAYVQATFRGWLKAIAVV